MQERGDQSCVGAAHAVGQVLRLGTRGSPLALKQTDIVIAALMARFPALMCEVTIISSLGDKAANTPLNQLEAQGIFTQALERALSERSIDAAVHSAKDLPSSTTDGLAIGAFPLRDSPLDCLVSRSGYTLESLPPGATIATSSPRREVQISATRPDIRCVPIRGNVDTRRRAALNGEVDAAVLAAAGLSRLGILDEYAVPLTVDICVPQAGQGALAIEALSSRSDVLQILSAIDDERTRTCVEAERAVLAGLAAGCQAPVAAYAEYIRDDMVVVKARVGGLDSGPIGAERAGPASLATSVGRELARELATLGADNALRMFRNRVHQQMR